VRPSDVTDGTSNTWLILERFHWDPVFDSYDNNSDAGQGIDTWGYWYSGSAGDGEMYPTVAVNYQMPAGLQDPQKWNEQVKRLDSMGSGHPGGANAALADGSVRFVTNEMSVNLIMAAATRNGGEIQGLGDDW
jgi:prepilin-type processing-associated H-X9-DG protein